MSWLTTNCILVLCFFVLLSIVQYLVSCCLCGLAAKLFVQLNHWWSPLRSPPNIFCIFQFFYSTLPSHCPVGCCKSMTPRVVQNLNIALKTGHGNILTFKYGWKVLTLWWGGFSRRIHIEVYCKSLLGTLFCLVGGENLFSQAIKKNNLTFFTANVNKRNWKVFFTSIFKARRNCTFQNINFILWKSQGNTATASTTRTNPTTLMTCSSFLVVRRQHHKLFSLVRRLNYTLDQPLMGHLYSRSLCGTWPVCVFLPRTSEWFVLSGRVSVAAQ